MRHKWKDDTCTTCSCTREKTYLGGKWTQYFYARSGIAFGSDRPDCIDWDLENSKTID